jgi:hemin uptake protein HemP
LATDDDRIDAAMTDHESTPANAAAGNALPVDAASSAEHAADSREKWSSEELLGNRIEILIQHGSEIYRLRRTRQDKLILYK